jgi:hypothetical protein
MIGAGIVLFAAAIAARYLPRKADDGLVHDEDANSDLDTEFEALTVVAGD